MYVPYPGPPGTVPNAAGVGPAGASDSVQNASGIEPHFVSVGSATPASWMDGSFDTSNTYVALLNKPPAKMRSPLCQRYCMWCGSFSASGPTVAVLTTLPYVDEDLSASRTARKSGAGGSSTASSFSVLIGFTAIGVR